jgi:glycosyltransferase involved in cell wall biosynthesis
MPSEENIITPQVAIVVIAFNEERRIAACVEALLAQDTSLAFEVIIVDDGSHDSTAEIVGTLAQNHSNIRLLRHGSNRGRGAARRTGQEATRAPLIGFVDADIIVPPDWLERCSTELSKFDAVSGIALPDGDCAVIWRICQPVLRLRPGSAEITGNNVLFTRDALTQIPFAPESKLGEDFRLAKMMVRHGLRLTTLRDLVVEHRESKSYREALKWMWHSGFDATAILFEYRVVRLPDLAWFLWTAGFVAAIILWVTDAIDSWAAVGTIVVLTLAVSGLFIRSRFLAWPRLLHYLMAQVIAPPLILIYLIGRGCGLFGLKGFRRL